MCTLMQGVLPSWRMGADSVWSARAQIAMINYRRMLGNETAAWTALRSILVRNTHAAGTWDCLAILHNRAAQRTILD